MEWHILKDLNILEEYIQNENLEEEIRYFQTCERTGAQKKKKLTNKRTGEGLKAYFLC